MADSSSPISVLQQWSQDGKLSEVALNPEGTTLTLGDVTIATASDKSPITIGDKSCDYSAASMFLQILNPGQGLLDYRKVCKQHSVKDPVKASDKATVVGYFLGQDATAVATVEKVPEKAPPVAAASDPAEAATTTEAAAAAPKEASHHKKKEHRSSSREGGDKHHRQHKDKHHKDKHRSSKDHKRKSSGEHKSSKGPKVRKAIDTEKLFSNLITVVDKRTSKQQDDEQSNTAQLVKALSPEGFTVTPELLSEYKDATATLTANEIPVGNSASILKAAAGKDLSRILKLYLDAVQPSSSGSKKSASASSGGSGQKKSWRPYLVGKKPIIILPKGMTAPLTLVNAHEFFGKAKFVPRDVMMKQGIAAKTAIKTTFNRRVGQRLGGGAVEYELMDNPKSKLPTSKDWDRVVAVVAMGQSWQFKDWPGHYSDPVKLFGSTFGFYIGLEGDKVPSELQGWSVLKANVSRDKRGMDSISHASFWNELDEFMAIHKPEMLPQPET